MWYLLRPVLCARAQEHFGDTKIMVSTGESNSLRDSVAVGVGALLAFAFLSPTHVLYLGFALVARFMEGIRNLFETNLHSMYFASTFR